MIRGPKPKSPQFNPPIGVQIVSNQFAVGDKVRILSGVNLQNPFGIVDFIGLDRIGVKVSFEDGHDYLWFWYHELEKVQIVPNKEFVSGWDLAADDE